MNYTCQQAMNSSQWKVKIHCNEKYALKTTDFTPQKDLYLVKSSKDLVICNFFKKKKCLLKNKIRFTLTLFKDFFAFSSAAAALFGYVYRMSLLLVKILQPLEATLLPISGFVLN